MTSYRDDPALLDPTRYPFAAEVPTRFQDVGPVQGLTSASIAAMLETAGVRLGYGDAVFHIPGIQVPMLRANSTEYLRPLRYPETTHIYFGQLDQSRTSWRSVMLVMQNERPCIFSINVMVMTDGISAIPIPDPFRRILEGRMLRSPDRHATGQP